MTKVKKPRVSAQRSTPRKPKPGMAWLFMQAIDRAVAEGRTVTITIEPTRPGASPNATRGFRDAKEKR